MPLSRSYSFAPIEDAIVETFTFPMVDGEQEVMVIVTYFPLRARADPDGLPSNIAKHELFNRYRDAVERIASGEYEIGNWHSSPRGDRRSVRLTNGDF